jgi:hypothetical protein
MQGVGADPPLWRRAALGARDRPSHGAFATSIWSNAVCPDSHSVSATSQACLRTAEFASRRGRQAGKGLHTGPTEGQRGEQSTGQLQRNTHGVIVLGHLMKYPRTSREKP